MKVRQISTFEHKPLTNQYWYTCKFAKDKNVVFVIIRAMSFMYLDKFVKWHQRL